VLEGDALGFLRQLDECCVDAVVTDPPYALGLRGVQWDRPTMQGRSDGRAFEGWSAAWAAECLRVLKPGGQLVAFGAPRTAHRLTSGLEDAGFEVRDLLLWLYGGGVPKNGLRHGRASGLKPAYEPIALARKPLDGSLDRNEERFGTGRLGIDDARIPSTDGESGRWPANVTLSHSPHCTRTRCRSTCAVGLLDRSHPSRPSRFFYCAKPSRAERDAGCADLAAKRMRIYGSRDTRPRRNTHPTVKPVDLMRWLVRLACPPGGTVLDPFTGSGSTGVAALHESRGFVGIERDPEYVRIARARLTHTAGLVDDGTVDARPDGVVSAAQSSSLSKGGTES
jgi:site-specific DNA-methyltransferase (adenine-specific)